ncbi:uncharacterized protein LOC106054460 [Biomphalaria glabrata]|uniref:Uncharacterized protein LOC106054460 n=1 Tax=Biomphalaria glabrata TaxID=6526 RepID=A0A9W3BM59_BIOGL|nr:uncharacterized protein LOC106054460 [Biomphalaria glabrata]
MSMLIVNVTLILLVFYLALGTYIQLVLPYKTSKSDMPKERRHKEDDHEIVKDVKNLGDTVASQEITSTDKVPAGQTNARTNDVKTEKKLEISSTKTSTVLRVDVAKLNTKKRGSQRNVSTEELGQLLNEVNIIQEHNQSKSNAFTQTHTKKPTLIRSSNKVYFDPHIRDAFVNLIRTIVSDYVIYVRNANHNRLPSEDTERVDISNSSLRSSRKKQLEQSSFQSLIMKAASRLFGGTTLESTTDSQLTQKLGTSNQAFSDTYFKSSVGKISYPEKIVQKSEAKEKYLERLVSLWKFKARQFSRLFTWLVLLPHRTLSFIRRLELANLKLRMLFFQRIIQNNIDSSLASHVDNLRESQAKQRKAFTSPTPRVDQGDNNKRTQANVNWLRKFQFVKKEDKKGRIRRSSNSRRKSENQNRHTKQRISNQLSSTPLFEKAMSDTSYEQRGLNKILSDTRRRMLPASRHHSKEDAYALRSRLLDMIDLVESRRNVSSESNTVHVSKETKASRKKAEYLDINDQLDPEQAFSKNVNNEPTDADLELLNNIELLTNKFLRKKNQNLYTGNKFERNRVKRSEVNVEGNKYVRNRVKRSEVNVEGNKFERNRVKRSEVNVEGNKFERNRVKRSEVNVEGNKFERNRVKRSEVYVEGNKFERNRVKRSEVNVEGNKFERNRVKRSEVNVEGNKFERNRVKRSEVNDDGNKFERNRVKRSEVNDDGNKFERNRVKRSEVYVEGNKFERNRVKRSEVYVEGNKFERNRVKRSEVNVEGNKFERNRVKRSEVNDDGNKFERNRVKRSEVYVEGNKFERNRVKRSEVYVEGNKFERNRVKRSEVNVEGNKFERNRVKRSEVNDDGTVEELTETANQEKLSKIGLEDNVKQSKQYRHKWGTLRKQAQNLQTEVNNARDKYASASDELAALLKRGNELQASASDSQGVHKSMLQENWKSANREFDNFKNDITSREKEVLSNDKAVNAEKIDQTLFKLEDAIREQGDPNDRILGESIVLPFNLEANKLDPALQNMKHEAALSEQIASNEVMLESEDAEDDVFKGSEAGDYNIVDLDYGPNAKFADEEDYDIAEDADSLVGFDYEVDRHNDAQLEDVDNMLSKLIARRFRSKRHTDLSDLTQENSLSPHNAENTRRIETKIKAKSVTHPAPAKREWRDGTEQVNQLLNLEKENDYVPEETGDFSDVLKDMAGSKLHDETKDPSSDSDLDFRFWVNHSNPASRKKFNKINDNLASEEIKMFDKERPRKKSMPYRKVSELLGFDTKGLGIDSKKFDKDIKKEKSEAVIIIPLGSNLDIEDGIKEIEKEKEFLTAGNERIDEEIPGDDELKHYDQIIEESMEEFTENNIGNEDKTLLKQEKYLEKTKKKLFNADYEKQRLEIASSLQKQRNQERRKEDEDTEEIDKINKGLVKAVSDLSQATEDLGRPPPKPEHGDQVRSLYAEDIEPSYRRKRNMVISNVNSVDTFISSQNRQIASNDVRKQRSFENVSSDVPNKHLNVTKLDVLNVFEHSTIQARPNASSRKQRKANLTLDEEPDVDFSTEESVINGFGDEFDEDEHYHAGSYVDDDLYNIDEDGDVLTEEWDPEKPPMKKNKPKLKSKKDDIDSQLLETKSVVRQLKEEEDFAAFMLPPSSMISSERDLLEFGRKPDAKDVFVNILEPVGLAELSEAEVNELNGPVLSPTDIERSLEDPTKLVSALRDIENEIKDTKLSMITQTQALSQLEGQAPNEGGVRSQALVEDDDSVDEVFRQINRAEDIGHTALEKKAIDERYSLLEDARRTRLRQRLLDKEDTENVALVGSVLGEALQDLDQYSMDKEDTENVALVGSVLGEALQDLDQYSVDKEVETLRSLGSFQDVLEEKRN